MTTPEPSAIIPVNAEPSPLNCVAVTTPEIFAPPVPVINLLNKSKLPPSWGDKSSTRFPIPYAPPPADTVLYETISTISPTNEPTANTTDVPLVAVNSASVNLTPLI